VSKGIYSKMIRLFVASLGVLLASCSISPGWRDSVRGTMDESMNEARGAKPPADVSKALLPPLELTLPDGKVAPLESRFDLNVNNAPARNVFLGLVEGSKYSVVVHQDVRGALTLNLKEVTVPEAFESIRRVYGYEYRREGNRFLVFGREMQMRLFNVNYLNLVRKGKSDTRVTATGLSSTSGGAGASATTSTSQSGVQVATETEMDFWKGLASTLTAIVGGDGGRKVIVNPQTGIVAIRAMPDELRMVEDYLGVTHATVNRQVVLEAKVIEVELNDGFQTGINWAKIQNNFTIGQTGGGTMLDGTGRAGTSDIAGNTGTLNPNAFSAISGTVASAFGGVFTVAARSDNFAAFVELLKTQGEVQVLSSPRVSTLNNQKAVIKVGTDEFFVTKQDITQSGVVGGTPTVTTELAPFFSGIALDVTPQIDENGNIILHIHPAVSDVSGKNITVAITGSTSQQLSTARSNVQESDNIVRALSGQVIVIGGLMKEGSTDENASVPLLGDIPIIGYLFKHKKVTRIKKELVILLKPTVVKLDQDWSDTIGDSQERIKKIRIGGP
jgi:MSHA biogenesis protein MshL